MVRLDEYKLLDNQIDRLAKVMKKMVTRCYIDKHNKTDLTNFTFTEEGETVIEVFQVTTEGKETQGYMTEIRQDIFPFKGSSPYHHNYRSRECNTPLGNRIIT